MKKISSLICLAMLSLYSPTNSFASGETKTQFETVQVSGEYKTLDGEVRATFHQEFTDEIGFEVSAKFPHSWFQQRAYHLRVDNKTVIVYNKNQELLFTMEKKGELDSEKWHYSGICGEIEFSDVKKILEIYDVEWYLVKAEKADIWKDGKDHVSIIVPSDKYKKVEKTCKKVKKLKD